MGRRRLRQGRQGCFVRGMGLHLGRAGLPDAHHPLFRALVAGICRHLVKAAFGVGPGLPGARQRMGAAEEAAQRVGRVVLPPIVAWSAAVIGGGGR